MSSLVLDARSWLDEALAADLTGASDLGPAMDRLASKLGIARAKLWALRYRPPKSIDAELYLKLYALHEAIRSTSLEVHADEKAREAPRTLVGRCLVGLAAAVDRANFGVVDGGAR